MVVVGVLLFNHWELTTGGGNQGFIVVGEHERFR